MFFLQKHIIRTFFNKSEFPDIDGRFETDVGVKEIFPKCGLWNRSPKWDFRKKSFLPKTV